MPPFRDIRIMKYLFVIFVVVDLSAAGASAQNVAPDRHALSAIFGERHIADNALTVHRRALKMPTEERFQYLSDWVLPGVDHNTIRVAIDFTPISAWLHPGCSCFWINMDTFHK